MTYNPRHIKLLTDEQLQLLKEKYDVEFQKNKVFVKLKTRNHTVMHDINEAFSLRCDNRRVTINPKAMQMWQKHFKRYSLFDVQHAINQLAIERINATPATVAEKLKRR